MAPIRSSLSWYSSHLSFSRRFNVSPPPPQTQADEFTERQLRPPSSEPAPWSDGYVSRHRNRGRSKWASGKRLKQRRRTHGGSTGANDPTGPQTRASTRTKPSGTRQGLPVQDERRTEEHQLRQSGGEHASSLGLTRMFGSLCSG